MGEIDSKESTPAGQVPIADGQGERRQQQQRQPANGQAPSDRMPGDHVQPASGASAQAPSNRKTGIIVAVVALVVVIAAGLFLYNALATSSAQQAKPGASGASAGAAGSSSDAMWLADYDAAVSTADGVELKLTQIAGGKPLVVNFWATWCPYCLQEMGVFQQIYDDYKGRVEFAFVDCVGSNRETVERGASWLAENGYTLPGYYDTRQNAQYMFGIANLPTTMVVAANGEILAISPGVISEQRMRSALDSLLAG